MRQPHAVVLVASLLVTTSTEGFQSLSNQHLLSPLQCNNKFKTRLRMSSATTHVSQEKIEALLEQKAVDEVFVKIKEEGDYSALSPALGAKLINAAATITSTKTNQDESFELARGPETSSGGQLMVSPLQEMRLESCYNLLKHVQLSKLYDSVDMNNLPLPYTLGCTIEMLEEKTGKPLSAFRPNPTSTRFYWLGGATACLIELLIAQSFHISPQPLFAATFAAAFSDQLLSGGAISEKILWTLQPSLSDRVICHEAGHLLVAHLLGCPVQNVCLGAWDALQKKDDESDNTASGGSAFLGPGTAFFDPELNAASRKGVVTRSVVDRYTIVLMAGIAAEAMNFGDSEGGSNDERFLTLFLSQTVQAKGLNIPEQARWAAANALILLREHKDAYERLVHTLKTKGSGDIGQIMMALEGYNV